MTYENNQHNKREWVACEASIIVTLNHVLHRSKNATNFPLRII